MTVSVRRLASVPSRIPPLPPPPPPPPRMFWKFISGSSLYYNPGYCPLFLDTRGASLIVLSFGTMAPPQLGFFFDTPANVGWQMVNVFNSVMMWILNPVNVSESHFFVLQGINFATASGAAFAANEPRLISSFNTNLSGSATSIAAAPVPITNPRQLVITGFGAGQYAPTTITGPMGYTSFIQQIVLSADGSGDSLHGSGLGYKIPEEGTEEQPVWTGTPAGPMSTRTLLFEAED